MKNMTGTSLVAEYLRVKLEESSKTQRDIATEVGYKNPNIITMFKQGVTKLPLTAVGPIARALDVDPVHLLRLALQEYYPETLKAVEDCLGATILTEREQALIDALRRSSAGTNPPIMIFEGKGVVGFALT